MFRLAVLTSVLCLYTVLCRPSQRQATVSKLAEEYAALHPNTDTKPNPEYGPYIDGDILVPEDKYIPIDVDKNPLNAVVDPDLLWPNGVMYYTLISGYTPDQIQKIEAGIQDLVQLTSVNGTACVQILPRDAGQTDYVYVQDYSGCSSYIGRIGGSQRISLVSGCVDRHGTIMHEFLHAFGFHHEQKRYDRDDYVTINWDNIEPGKEHNFNMIPEGEIDLLGTTYDYGSVLHYSAYAFAVDDSIPTIIPTDPDAEIGQRITLSQLDIERVQILYGCISPAESVYFKNVDPNSLPKMRDWN